MLNWRPLGLRRLAAIGAHLALAALAAAGPARAAPTTTLVYERTLMQAAGARCRLFRPDVLSALAASAAQARGAAIRGGLTAETVDGAAERARSKAFSVPCDSKDLAVAAGRLRVIYDSYAQLRTMSFPGQFADWRAERPRPTPSGKAPMAQWSLLQFAPAGRRQILFGLVSVQANAPTVTAVDAAPSPTPAATVRLVMRDPLRDPKPYLDDRRRGLANRIPARDLDQVYLASARFAAPVSLLPPGAHHGESFSFPPTAATALAQLDPREAVLLEFVYPTLSGDRVEAAWIEAGDFNAARAFLAVRLAPKPAAR